VPRARRAAGVALSGFAVLFLAFDGVIKLLPIEPVVKSFAEIGFPAELSIPVGVLELLCVAFYVVPRSTVLGAVLLTAFLGGATAIKARLEDPWLLLSVAFGLLVWAGLFLRDPSLRVFLPLRRPRGQPALCGERV
jgi:hypothetical protein